MLADDVCFKQLLICFNDPKPKAQPIISQVFCIFIFSRSSLQPLLTLQFLLCMECKSACLRWYLMRNLWTSIIMTCRRPIEEILRMLPGPHSESKRVSTILHLSFLCQAVSSLHFPLSDYVHASCSSCYWMIFLAHFVLLILRDHVHLYH